MLLSESIKDHVAAGFPILWVKSIEHDDAEQEIIALANLHGWQFARWDLDRGCAHGEGKYSPMPDPLTAVHLPLEMANGDKPVVLIARNLHRFISDASILQALDTLVSDGKRSNAFLVVLAPACELPPEVERLVIVIQHELPSRDDLEKIGRSIATEPGEMPEGLDLEAVRDASAGLTRFEAEGAFSLSLARHGKIQPDEIWDIKIQAVRKSGALEVYRGSECFKDLGGLDAIKRFGKLALRYDRPAKVQPRGVLLLGVPGTGKSAWAKALGNETGRPTITMDIGAMFGSLVGQSEERTRQALAIADAMAPCVLFIDEIDKGLAGSGSGSHDSGVGQRMFGTFLTWLNDHQSDVFVVATSNDISALPSAFTRSERWDGIFFIDFPTPDERRQIWSIWQAAYGHQKQALPNDNDWTGAEIKACCRLASLLGLSLKETGAMIVPVASTAAESVGALRTWAHGRCLDAQTGLHYESRKSPLALDDSKPRRSVQRPVAKV